jgi:hypothetical protein
MSPRPLILVLGILLVLGLGGNLLGQTIGAGREAGAAGALAQGALNTAAAPAPATLLARQPQATATPCVGSPGSWRAGIRASASRWR